MKILYVDESGDTVPLSQSGKKFLVLTGCVIDDADFHDVENKLRSIKYHYYGNQDTEFKSNFIRYANPDIGAIDSPLKLHDREKYNQLESELAEFMKALPITLISIVIDKEAYWKNHSSKNPYEKAYALLMERFNIFLKDQNNDRGMVIIDPREGRVDKQFIGDHLKIVHHGMRFGSDWQQKTDQIIERLLYSASEDTIGIQLADLFGYPIFHLAEYNKKPAEYWRFSEITQPKLYQGPSKQIKEYGLSVYPKTKKDPPDGSLFDGRGLPRDHLKDSK